VACTMGSRSGEPARSQAVASSPCVLPADVCPPLWASFSWQCPRSTGSFAATRSGRRMSPMGRVLPTASVGYAVAQLEGQLSGGEITHPIGAGRPSAVVRCACLNSGNSSGIGLFRLSRECTHTPADLTSKATTNLTSSGCFKAPQPYPVLRAKVIGMGFDSRRVIRL
jgi:hypothetical protein